MKLGKACLQCRQAKRKCDSSATFSTRCNQCAQRGLACSRVFGFHHGLARRSNPACLAPAQPSQQVRQDGCLDEVEKIPQYVIDELLDLYFTYIHHKPHTMFHEPSFRKSSAKGEAPKAVLYGVMANSVRFSSTPSTKALEPAFLSCAKSQLKANLESICLENVQAAVLIGNACFASCDADAESIYYAIAIRTGQLLGLSREPSTGTQLQREIRRRVWWSLYMIDRWGSAGLALPMQLFTHSANAPRVPMDEVAFAELPGDDDDDDDESKIGRELVEQTSWQPGLWAHMITLVRIFGLIQDLNASLVVEDKKERLQRGLDGPALSTDYLASQLKQFVDELPEKARLTDENLLYHSRRGQGRTFVALHLGYHHYATLLYFQYLDGQRQQTVSLVEDGQAHGATINTVYSERCRYHARKFSDLLRASNTVPNCEVYYNIVGHMTVVSSSVLLHTLLFGDASELPATRERLEYNFRVLIKLRTYWASVDLMISRLFKFQNSCLQSVSLPSSSESMTHRVDNWMVRYLLQHALDVDEKDNDTTAIQSQSPSSLMSGLDHSPAYQCAQPDQAAGRSGRAEYMNSGGQRATSHGPAGGTVASFASSYPPSESPSHVLSGGASDAMTPIEIQNRGEMTWSMLSGLRQYDTIDGFTN